MLLAQQEHGATFSPVTWRIFFWYEVFVHAGNKSIYALIVSGTNSDTLRPLFPFSHLVEPLYLLLTNLGDVRLFQFYLHLGRLCLFTA